MCKLPGGFWLALGSLSASILAVSTAAHSEDSILYLRADVGAALSTSIKGDIYDGSGFGHNFGSSFAGDIGIGAHLPAVLPGFALRTELILGALPDFSSDHNAAGGGGTTATRTRVSAWTAMDNVYLDIATGSIVTPFVGMGFGFDSNQLGALTYTVNGKLNSVEAGKTAANFAWGPAAGLGVRLTPAITSDITYRYIDAGEVRSSGAVTLVGNGVTVGLPPLKDRLHYHELMLGMRYAF